MSESQLDQPWLKLHQELDLNVPEYDGLIVADHLAQHTTERGSDNAIHYFDRTLNFSELTEYANKLANSLVSQGIKQRAVVGIHLPNIPAYPIAVAALSKANYVGSGVSPLLQEKELAYQLNDASIEVLITLDAFLPMVLSASKTAPSLKLILVCTGTDFVAETQLDLPKANQLTIVSFMDEIESASAQFSSVKTDSESTCFIQYTGGTTGQPKGAELSHKNLVYNPVIYNCADTFDHYGYIALSPFPYFHVAGLSVIFDFFVHGLELVLIPDPRNLEHIINCLKKFDVSVFAGVPAIYSGLLAESEFRQLDFSSLKKSLTGAAPMPVALKDELNSIYGKAIVSDVFGMTETSPVYTVHPLSRQKVGAIGFPAPRCDVRIVNADDKTVLPFGEAGEISTAGPQVMKGYLNRPEQTAETMFEADGKQFLMTGDVGYMDEEGYIFLCDRSKDMLIVGGFKVFSVELEDKLADLHFIEMCAVIGSPDEKRPGNDIVNLFVQLKADKVGQDQDLVKQEILTWMREHLAPYKIPKKIHIIEEIPQTAVGKLDKKKLRAALKELKH